jgi:AraC-like DNA-binding protein/ligand-binding sensor protein
MNIPVSESKSPTHRPIPLAARLLERLHVSEAFANYRQSFECATGLPVWLVSAADEKSCEIPCPATSSAANAFCMQLNGTASDCPACVSAHASLTREKGEDMASIRCFAGFYETAVPVRLGSLLIGYLRTGQVLPDDNSAPEFADVAAAVAESMRFSHEEWDRLRESYQNTQRIAPARYRATVQLLVHFSRQLSAELERLKDAPEKEFPDSVQRACKFLREAFDRDVPLDDVAKMAGLSPNHLCQVFKAATGMTLTEFQNRERIQHAKKRLCSRYARVSEVALDVGFGSLSQFNRCFLRYTGESPTKFRNRMVPKAG